MVGPDQLRVAGGPPVPPVNRALFEVTRRATLAWLCAIERVEVTGLERIPRRGAAIIAPNHLSVFDSTVLFAVLPRLTRFIGKAEYVESLATRHLFTLLGNIPVDRSDSASGAHALEVAAAVLGAGELFGIFPEGTRSRDGLLHRGKTGVGRLALRTGAPVVPVGLIGTDRVQHATDPLLVVRPGHRVTVRVGEPMALDRYRRLDPVAGARALTDDLMGAIAALSGQRYVDEYSARPRR
ncbi:MAG TPA: lysophospholipid acyltransferase family protein [Acidimicrobiales bacterium]|nr:lysophospholipid acyltransferase family protein [Acidimicrobiales bacterium]